jgi:V/A-type H+-transporting ATPase subunit E
MAENLQNLLNRIQQDGVEKANAEAESIVSKAKQEAAELIRSAEELKASMIAEAERESRTFAERGEKALQQAARDVVLSIGDALDRTLGGVIDSRLGKAMTDDVLKQMIVKVVEAYSSSGSSGAEIALSTEDEEKLSSFFMNELATAVREGCVIRGDGKITSGFRVSMAEGHVSHDFTGEAIGDALARLVRPHLAEVTRRAIADMQGAQGANR